MRKTLVADLLCGAGGSSTGCRRALAELGLRMELVCVNHWPVAIDTHTLNHPEARHYCQDISTVRPHLVVPEGYLDLLMASPSCTHHSVARGGKPTSDQQRSDPWHIITWFTELRVKRAIIENVWEYTGWGPVDPRSGKPIKARKGEYHRAWIDTIWRLGATSIEWRKINAADYGAATTRQRYIAKIRFDRVAIGWAPITHRKREAGKVEPFPTLRPWRPARDIIDWNIKGRSIFGRKKPLAPKTLARIYAGAVKFNWPEPFLVILRNHMAGQSVDGPLPTIAAGGTHIGLAQPVMLANRTNNAAKSPKDSPLPCLTTAHGGGIGIAEPVIMNGRKNNRAKAVSIEPVPTLDTKGGVWLAEPFVMGTGAGAPRGAGDPLPTITTGGAGFDERPGCARPMLLVEPLILNRHSAPRSETRSVSEPVPTPTTSGGGYLVEPFVLSRQGGGAPRSIDEPTPAQVAKHSHVLVAPYYGSGSGETCRTANEPLPTVTSKARFGMVVPITHSDGGLRARDVESDPIPTVTTAHRGELAFITAQFGEREGQAPRVHDVEHPAPTIAATGHINLIEGTPQYDILFRMLEPHELAAAMGFNRDDFRYAFAGNKTEQIKQIGNAVSVDMMCAEVKAIMVDAAPAHRAAAGPREASQRVAS